VDWEHGGKGLNLGLGLHRLGAEVHMIMAVGADLPGWPCVRHWSRKA
jgi:sugar/nucleoside kinase (ribokinase family)